MKQRRGIVDLSSVIWTNLLGGKDTEFGRQYLVDGDKIEEIPRNKPKVEGELGKRMFVNSASYGYEKSIDDILQAMKDLRLRPRDLILVMEGKNSKADRQALHPTYKVGRDKLAQQYEQFNLCKEQVIAALLSIGAQMCWQDGGVEADDVIGYLALNLKGERYIISGDKDLAQLVGRDPDIHHYRQSQLDRNPFGDFDPLLIPVWIACVGDTGDKIPGAKGFGETYGNYLVMAFGNEGLTNLEGLIRRKELLRLQEDVHELPALQKLIDDAAGVYLSYELGRLRVEKVNTLKRPLQWRAGVVRQRGLIEDSRLRTFGGVNKLVSAENYDEALAFFMKHLPASPCVALDIETSTPPESDEWLERQGKEDKMVDVFGSELTGFSVTFGPNMQYTLYLTVDHVPEPGVTNISIAQARDFCAKIPKHLITWVHNAMFELPVLFNAWGKDWEASDKVYRGYLPNVRDTRVASHYVDENRRHGLKSLSKELLDYDQETYDNVTQKTYEKANWDQETMGGKLIKVYQDTKIDVDEKGDEIVVPVGPELVLVQHKMNELPASHVLSYGCDDTITTAGLQNHFVVVMELEHTYDVFDEVETFANYMQAKAFIDGVDFSLESMSAMEKEDDQAYDKAWGVLRQYLIEIGFDGTLYEPITELNGASIKRALLEITGHTLETQVRTPSKLAKMIRELDLDGGDLLAQLIDNEDLESINSLMSEKFDGEPRLDLGSAKQMARLLYDCMGLPVNIVNDATDLQRKENPDLANALRRFKKHRMSPDVVLTTEELRLVRTKAKANDDAIAFALAFDTEYVDERARAALEAIGTMKKVMTRRSLFYKNYWNAKHWKDGKIHAQVNPCGTVTRRPTGSSPNLYQLPKKGEGVRFREHFVPHTKDGVIGSIDFTGQELRLAAERSQDKNLLACYVGENLKDVHSITAAGAMKLKWTPNYISALYQNYGHGLNPNDPEDNYTLFRERVHKGLPKGDPDQKKADDLRKDSKNVNFAAQFGGQALKLSETLIMRVTDAQLFLDARSEMFPGVDAAAERAEEFVNKHGYALTMMGARRHLRVGVIADDRWANQRAERQAWNMEIQGSAGEMTKLAMKRFWMSGIMWERNVRYIASIYDELVISAERDAAVEALRVLHDVMVMPYSTMKVPILASISVGPNFADQTECGDWFIEKNVRDALNDIFKEKEAA